MKTLLFLLILATALIHWVFIGPFKSYKKARKIWKRDRKLIYHKAIQA